MARPSHLDSSRALEAWVQRRIPNDCGLPSAGVFAEDIFRGLDYAIAQGGRFGLKVVVPLSNYWDFHDSLGDVSFHAFE